MLPSLFAPAVAQIEAKWPSLSPEQREKLAANLPDFTERAAVLDWNARLSLQSPRFLEPCQAVYQALMAWDSLSTQERVVVMMAGIEPISKTAYALGLVAGIPARAVT